MNIALLVLENGTSLVAYTDELQYEPKCHMYRPHLIGGKTKVTLTPWPEHSVDEHVLLSSNRLLTVCEPTDNVKAAYEKKVPKPLPEPSKPVILNEDENVPEVDDEYEPRYVEEPLY